MRKGNSTLWLSIVTIAIVIGGIVLLVKYGTPEDTRTTREIAMICTTDMATRFHIHPNISIVVDGVVQTLPAQIGVNAGCMNPLHTHDTSGKIHVESPVKRDFTLGDFFAVWGKTFNKDQILDYEVDETHVIKLTVNGIENQDFENLVLDDDDQAVISYETVPTPATP